MGNWKQLSPSTLHRLDMGLAYGLTDVGTVREANQDNFFIAPDIGLVVVADGMGGHEAGEIASADAITLLHSFIEAARGNAPAAPDDATVPAFHASAFDPVQADPDATWTDATMRAMITLHDAVEFANERMYQTNRANHQPDGTGMGTTLTGMWQVAPDGPVFIFHVGDSRLYCFRQGRLTQLTRDQTLYQQALEAGMQEPLPARNLLLQALGPAHGIKPDLQTQAVAPGDVYLLCSDGLYGNSTPEAIAAILSRVRDDNLPACCAELVDMAKRDGSRDNITAVLVRCGD
ncbi:PP2C family protein-serine/threonine phosphatase [Pseudoduganella namucuonensis]|uniref:Protein phosphatase n=1 Tax=Pseudoduganella namucuonensis TaxID=1035707 RepID=A0A1I7L4K5_9BURK|nr:protein phosphatase 2C domain-containing protein [Pseudoduganella namucuonensis]SFV04673.1 protein phosphatase [Pseudoduganella namucuonensis]